MTERRIRMIAVVRAGWAAALLLAPQRLLRAGGRAHLPAAAVPIVRVLGGRHLLQAMVSAAAATRSVAGAGAVVDALHTGSSVGLGAVSSRWRRVALMDAVAEGAFVAAGLWSARRRATKPRRRQI